MASFGKGSSFFTFIRTSGRLLFCQSKSVSHKPGRWIKILRTGVASAAVGGALCAVPFRQAENLSHDSLIRRAASLVTDSSSTFLSQASLALIDAITEYSKAVHTLVALQRQYLNALGKLTPAEEDSIWQVILGQRAEVNDRQDKCQHFQSTWVAAVRLSETAAEAAYTSGAEHAAITMRTNIQVAETQVEEARRISMDADKKLAETKVMEIERVAKFSASTENSSDEEEEIPEAYLRED